MASADAPRAVADRGGPGGVRGEALRLLPGVMEAIVLAMVALSPWAFGTVELKFEFVLFVGVAALLALWGARMLLEWRLRWTKCPVVLCLAALYIGGMWQVTPLPGDVLARLSPVTARMYGQLLPREPEAMPPGEEMPAVNPPPGSTISLYPGATQALLLRLLAVFLLFAVVRTNVTSAAALRRLGLVALVNGMLLAHLGLIQYFSSPHDLIYWSVPTATAVVFGPFVHRNHFAFYMNMCIGLAAGQLLNRYYRLARDHRGGRAGRGRSRPARRLLLDPELLGMGYALALMVSSVLFCLSRGGFLAMLGGSIVCMAIQLSRSDRSLQRGATLLPLAMGLSIASLAVAMVAWFGVAPVAARLGTLGDALLDSRLVLWGRVLPLVREFPLWGTGYGTFRHLEPLHAAVAADTETEYVFAHNEYLEAMLEGGLVRLIATLAAVGLVLRLGYRAVRRAEGRPADGLALGAFFGFTAIAIHSVVEFGLHIPAIALLATVLGAHLCALGGGGGGGDGPTADRGRPTEDVEADGDAGEFVLRLGGLAPLVGAATAVALGLLLVDEGSRAVRAEPFRRSAARLRQQADPASRRRRLSDLEAAARLTPEDAQLQVSLAQAHLAIYEDGLQAIEEGGRSDDATRVELEVRQRVPALGHYLQARDLCPILPEPHLGIASLHGTLGRAEPRGVYLERAKRLAPADPLLWYLYGLEELYGGRPEQAWRSWRRSLELSDRYRPNILDLGARKLAPDEILRLVIPDRPDVLMGAASYLFPDPEATEGRRPFLEKAMALLNQRPAPLTADDLHLKGQVYSALDRPAEALAAYREALAREPLQVEWRYELAELLYQQGGAEEAYRELLTVLGLRPDHGPARELREAATRRISETR